MGRATKGQWAKVIELGQNQSKKTVHQAKKAASHLFKPQAENETEKRDEWPQEEIENLNERLQVVEEKLKNQGNAIHQKETKSAGAKNSNGTNGAMRTKQSESDTGVSSDDDTVSGK